MRHHSMIKKPTALYSIGIVGFFFALHAALPSYFNSSFLGTFTDEKTVGIIYLIVSIITIVGFLSMNTLLKKWGNLRVSISLILLQIVTFYGLITFQSPYTIIAMFIAQMCFASFISLTLDIFLQKSTDIGHTGSIRGLYMTAINMGWVCGPLIGGLLIAGTDYKPIYMAAFGLLFPLLYIIYKNFGNFKDSHYVEVSARQTFMRILRDKDITRIFFINIILQTFYAWMVVYTPMYLFKNIGFDWSQIGIIFTIMLLPFILIELPLGKLADKKWGEKEILTIGFVIMGISTIALSLFTVKSVVIWAILLFITRIGAAAAEVMIETYFFKKVDGKDPEILSMFRTTRPLSFFIAPIITTVGLAYTTDQYLFVILGVICLFTLYPVMTIRDTN